MPIIRGECRTIKAVVSLSVRLSRWKKVLSQMRIGSRSLLLNTGSVFVAASLLLGFLAAGMSRTWAQSEGFFVTADNAAAYQKMPEIESQLYGHAYGNQSVPERMVRIERTLFGASQHGSITVRMGRIEQRMGEQNSKKTLAEQEPILEYLEQKLFQRTYQNQPLPERIHHLEMQVFGRSFENYPLSVRIKKLTYAMPLMAKEIRLTKGTPNGDMVVASTHRVSRMASRVAPKVDMVQLDATGGTLHAIPKGPSLSSGDYNQSIYREPSGVVVRWVDLPVKVYLKPDLPASSMGLTVVKAWQDFFSVMPVEQSAAADVIVTWDKASWDQNTTGLPTRPVVQVDDRHTIRTVILISMYPFRELPKASQLHALSHQLGHAFGLWGHSEDTGDIMYPQLKQELNDFPSRWGWRSAGQNQHSPQFEEELPEGFAPSQRDINTLLKLYNQPANALSDYSPY